MTDFFRRHFSDDFMPHGHGCPAKPEIARPPVFGVPLPREAAKLA